MSLNNRQAYFGRGPELELIKPYFQYRMKGYQFTPAYRNGWDGYIKFLRNGRVPTGLFLTLRQMLEDEGLARFHVFDERIRPRFNSMYLDRIKEGKTKLFPFQVECVLEMVKRSRTGGIVLNATGSGKTFIAAAYFRALRGRGLFIVDERTLMRQAKDEIESFLNERVGILGDSVQDIRRVTVATVQSLALYQNAQCTRKLVAARELVMVFDELHLALNKRTFDVSDYYAPLACFGLTATLEWNKVDVQLQAAALCGPIIYRYRYQEGRAENRLAKGVVMGVDVRRDIVTREPDQTYADHYRESIVNSKRRNVAIVELVKEAVRRGKYVIVLVERVAHVAKLAKRLQGVPVEVVFGGKKTHERLKAKDRFEAGQLKVLIANRVFKKGINLKRADFIIDAAAMKNRNDPQQKFGRGVRLFAGKRGLIYIDIGDVSRSGLEDMNPWQAGTEIRRKALADLGVQIKVRTWKPGAAASVLDTAEKMLRR